MVGRVEADEEAGGDHECPEDEELGHSMGEGEREVVRSDNEEDGWIEPVEVVEGGGSDEGEKQGDDEGGLHAEGVHGVSFGEGGGAAHEAEEKLGEGKDKHTGEDKGKDGVFGCGPGGEDGGGELDEAGDEPAGESSTEGGAHVALGVGDLHGFYLRLSSGEWGSGNCQGWGVTFVTRFCPAELFLRIVVVLKEREVPRFARDDNSSSYPLKPTAGLSGRLHL
jgi:hypothetical protein